MSQPTEQTTTTAPLPVREKCTPAELELMDRFMDDHGDPSTWSYEISHAWAATIACARAAGAL